MDAAGNLTELSEFSNERRIRFISYMDPDIAMGVHARATTQPDYTPIPLVQPKFMTTFGVQRLSGGDLGDTVFFAGMVDSDEVFSLAWAGDPTCIVEWGPDGNLGIRYDFDPAEIMSENGSTAHFTVDFVDGCWFALNIPDRSRVVDIYEARTDDKTPIILWPWHGGANQIWRAEAV